MTAKEFLEDRELYHPNIEGALVEFTKMHTIKALKQASHEVCFKEDYCTIDTESILNAYPLTNIK